MFAAAALVLLILGTAALALVRACWPLTFPARDRPDLVTVTVTPDPAAIRPDPAAGWRLAGIVAGAVGAALVARTPDLGRGLLLAAPVFGLGVFAGALTGELARPLPAGQVRRAGLRVRRVADYLPRRLGAVVAVSIVVLAALSTATTVAGSSDDMGRAGRALTCAGAGLGPWPGPFRTASPWPGSYYTGPVLAVVVAGLALAGFALRQVVRRPQPAELAAADDVARRRSAEVITAATGILTLVPLSGIALTAGLMMGLTEGVCETWWPGAGMTLSVVGFAAFAGAAWCGACLLLPARRTRA